MTEQGGMFEVPGARLREMTERIRELERELSDALVVTAAIIARYGYAPEDEPDRRVVIVDGTALESITAGAPTVYREDHVTGGGFALSLRVDPVTGLPL